MSDNRNIASEAEAERFRMHPAPAAPQQQVVAVELQQAEYPPDILPVYVAKLYGVSHTPGDPDSYPTPPPPPTDTPSGLDPIVPLPPPVTDPPANIDVPVVSQFDDVLTCTMGNWTGEPTAYFYAWQLDGTAAGSDQNTLTVTVDDAGKTAICTVTATNAYGATAAPPSPDVVVV